MRQGRLFALISCAAFWGGGCASARAQGVFESSGNTDVARAWLDLLFRGAVLPGDIAASAPGLGSVAAALHRALGIYSTGILVVAALLLFYNLAVLIVETAHYGVPLGRRSAQVWAPLRLILAICFLVPVSGGLNAGQYLVAWMAEQGSGLASRAWEIAAVGMHEAGAGLTLPRGPDVAGFVAGGLEMELCRALYRRDYAAANASPAVQAAGNIGDIEKLPRTRFAEETWQYSNRLHAPVPLCGAYRFAASKPPAGDAAAQGAIDRFGGDLAEFSRAEADTLIAQTQLLAENNVGVFLGDTPGAGVHDDVASLVARHRAALEERMHAVAAADPDLMDGSLGDSANAGWITAGGTLMALARLQEMYGTLASHALPSIEPPVLAESDFLHPSLADAIAGDATLRALPSDQLTPLTAFYAHLESTVRLARVWLYDRQLADMPLVLANPFDLRDRLDTSSDPEAISSLFGHVLNDAAIAYGVWNSGPAAAPAVAVGADQPLLALPVAVPSAITGLAEFGRRQAALGNYLFGIAGPDVAPAGTLAYTLMLGAVGLLFLASGFALMFLIPLLPFIRFFLGVLAWLLSILEAIVAVPVVALAHLNLSGEGLSGGAARHAYLLWLNIIIRPALTLFGFVAGLLLFTFAIVFLGMAFDQLARLAAPADGAMFVTINVVLTLLYTVLAVAAANASFKGITLLPEMAFKWLGGLAAPQERIELPASAGPAGVHALPNLSASAALLAQRGAAGGQGGRAESRASAALETARSHGLKTALFPNLRESEKPATETQKQLAQIVKPDGAAKAAGTPRAAAPPPQAAPAKQAPRDLQKPEKPDKRRAPEPETEEKKTETDEETQEEAQEEAQADPQDRKKDGAADEPENS